MTMTKIESSCINSIGYDETNRELYVEFKNGNTYIYPNVSKDMYEKFLNSPSKGRFINDYFVGTKCRKL
jgi:hypothetical protein